MKVSIELKKIGSSKGFVIPKSFLLASGLKEGSIFDFETMDNGSVKISPTNDPHRFLKDFFAKNPDAYLESELALGDPFSNNCDNEKEDFSDMF